MKKERDIITIVIWEGSESNVIQGRTENWGFRRLFNFKEAEKDLAEG